MVRLATINHNSVSHNPSGDDMQSLNLFFLCLQIGFVGATSFSIWLLWRFLKRL